MFGKKLKKLLIVVLSCLICSTSVPITAMAEDLPPANNEVESDHNKVSESHAYPYCSPGYRKVTLLPSVLEVDPFCFADNLDVEEIVWMASADTVPYNAFWTCPKLKTVKLSDNVKYIEEYAFGQCISLTNVVLPKNLRKINDGAFWGCRSLKTLYIPETVTEIGFKVFDGCKDLVIHGKKNSFAYYYCKINNIPFVSDGTAEKPANDRPYIKSAKSKVMDKKLYITISLNAKVKNVDGYQYQLCRSKIENNPTATEVLVSKNSRKTTYTFEKAPLEPAVFARVRAYTIKNGKKVYSNWSNKMQRGPYALKTDNIKLTKVTAGTKKVIARFSKLKYSDGYDCVLINAETREKFILKNQKNSTITFKNIAPGTYCIKAHAYTKLNGIKQFGAWSDEKEVIVK